MRRCPDDNPPAVNIDGVDRETRRERLGARHFYNSILWQSKPMHKTP
jgi:hypothetical protein